MLQVLSDCRHIVTSFRRRPFAVAVLAITCAVAIGANSAVFAVLDAVLLSPLAVADQERLIALQERNDRTGRSRTRVPSAVFRDWIERTRTLESLGGIRGPYETNLSVPGIEVRRARLAAISPSLFAALGVQPSIGRVFVADDISATGRYVALVRRGVWGVPAIRINGEVYAVVGTIPNGLRHFGDPDVVVPLWLPVDNRVSEALSVIGKRRSGTSLEQVQAEFDSIAKALELEYPATDGGWTVVAVPLREALVSDAPSLLLLIMLMAACVLFVGCINVASVLLARVIEREPEFAIRAALGAGPRQIGQHVVTESIVLMTVGALIAITAVPVVARLVANLGAYALPSTNDVNMSWRVWAFVGAVVSMCGIGCGIVPAWCRRSCKAA